MSAGAVIEDLNGVWTIMMLHGNNHNRMDGGQSSDHFAPLDIGRWWLVMALALAVMVPTVLLGADANAVVTADPTATQSDSAASEASAAVPSLPSSGVSPEEQEVFRLFDELGKVNAQQDPQRAAEVKKQLDAAMEQMNRTLQKNPRAAGSGLPAAPNGDAAKGTKKPEKKFTPKWPAPRPGSRRRSPPYFVGEKGTPTPTADADDAPEANAPSPQAGKASDKTAAGDLSGLEGIDALAAQLSGGDNDDDDDDDFNLDGNDEDWGDDDLAMDDDDDDDDNDDEIAEPVIPAVAPSPNDVVQIDVKDNMLDVGLLVDTIGKEMKLTFLYDDDKGVGGRVKLQQFGEIHRRDLLPLLESVLSFQQLGMVRQGPFVRIVKRPDVLKKVDIPLRQDPNAEAYTDTDMIVAQIVELDYTDPATVKALLGNFVDALTVVDIPNSNTLILTDYAHRMARLLELIAMIDQPGPDHRLEVFTMDYLQAADTVETIQTLLKALGDSESTGSTPAAASPSASHAAQRRAAAARRRAAARRGQPAPKDAKTPAADGAESPEAFFYADARTNRLIVIGTDDQIEQITYLLGLLDVAASADDLELADIQIRYIEVAEIVEPLTQLLEALSADSAASSATPADPKAAPARTRRTVRSRRDRSNSATATRAGDNGPLLLPIERNNRLLIVGTADQIIQVEDLIAVLDIEASEYGDQPRLETYQPQYVEVAEARAILDDLGITRAERVSPRDRARGGGSNTGPTATEAIAGRGGTDSETPLPGTEEFQVRVALQEDLNKMFVLATGLQHEAIAEIMSQIDQEAEGDAGTYRIYKLKNREPADVSGPLKELLDSAREVTGTGDASRHLPGSEDAPTLVDLEKIRAVGVRATSKQHDEILTLIQQMDIRLPGVLLEAILVQVRADDALDIGVTLQNTVQVNGTKHISGISPFPINAITRTGNIVSGTGGTIAFMSDDLVYATLEALQSNEDSKIISKPRILVTDNEEGVIESKRSEPTTKTTLNTGSDVPITDFNTYVDAGTTLTITPHIGDANALTLFITLQVDSFDGEGSGNIPPPKSSNKIDTKVDVPDGKTVVLGGLTTTTNSMVVSKVPLLGDIPILGAAFRKTSRSYNKVLLYVFVKAHIIRSEEGSDEPFGDLMRVSQYYRDDLKDGQDSRKKQSVIPGIPDPPGPPDDELDDE